MIAILQTVSFEKFNLASPFLDQFFKALLHRPRQGIGATESRLQAAIPRSGKPRPAKGLKQGGNAHHDSGALGLDQFGNNLRGKLRDEDTFAPSMKAALTQTPRPKP